MITLLFHQAKFIFCFTDPAGQHNCVGDRGARGYSADKRALIRITTWTRCQRERAVHSNSMASASSAWLSVVVKRGPTVVPRKILNVAWESSFGDLMVAALRRCISDRKRYDNFYNEVAREQVVEIKSRVDNF